MLSSTERSERLRRLRHSLPLLIALAPACYDFRLTGPEDAAAVVPPNYVSVTVEYRQPNGCLSAPSEGCDQPVVFFGSWMRSGGEFRLQRLPGSLVWRGTAVGVPVNFPPRDDPYEVRIFDPYLLESCAEGFSADRITLGGESLIKTNGHGCRDQAAFVFVDDNGRGHHPY
jgi:hypothetical protein